MVIFRYSKIYIEIYIETKLTLYLVVQGDAVFIVKPGLLWVNGKITSSNSTLAAEYCDFTTGAI